MSDQERIPFSLTSYGLPHCTGYLPTRGGQSHPDPLTPIRILDLAVELGLEGVDMPLPPPEVLSPQALRDALEERRLKIVAEFMVLVDMEAELFRERLRAAAAAGAKVARALFSRILCGDRRALDGGWDARLNAVASRLRELLPCAEDLGLCIAMENHQDATTEDLIRLGEMVGGHPAYGVTLDAGNPLAVGQDPVDAARRLAPLIRHLHLKDYTLHFAPEGYRLVRCAAGEGVVDFAAILEAARANRYPHLLPGIEIAAQPTRTIPLLEAGWWDCYPPRDARELLPVLRILWAKGRPMHEPYSSAWERGEDSATVAAEEMELVRRSVAWFRVLTRGKPS